MYAMSTEEDFMVRLFTLFALLGITFLMLAASPLFAADATTPVKEAPMPAVSSPATHNEQGIVLFEKGDYGAAILEFNRALAENPADVSAFINLGLSYAVRGQYKAAIDNLYYALDIDKNNIVALKHLAALYFLSGKHDKSIEVFNRITALNPDDFKVYIKRGVAYAAKRLNDAAIQDFTRAIYLDGNYFPGYLYRGISLTAKGKYEWAIADFGNALRIAPTYPFVYLVRSEAYARSGHFRNALEDLNKACSLGDTDICEALRQARSDIEQAGSPSILIYSKKTSEEELYTSTRNKLDAYFISKQSSEMNKLFDESLRTVYRK